MNFTIPRILVRGWHRFGEWGNVPVLQRYPAFVRIDVLMAIGFAGTVAWYGLTQGLMGAVQGGVLYLVFTALALFSRA